MEAWLNDCDGVFQNKGEEMPKDISWNFLAMVLLAGSFMSNENCKMRRLYD